MKSKVSMGFLVQLNSNIEEKEEFFDDPMLLRLT